ncbi:MAG: hypothetical protein J3K34DRAFT_180147 [Monoraphidium minutum]|nr:MAG: hypothetical protein J3K34DRAFT_180147 [Monoraphidium minutum]
MVTGEGRGFGASAACAVPAQRAPWALRAGMFVCLRIQARCGRGRQSTRGGRDIYTRRAAPSGPSTRSGQPGGRRYRCCAACCCPGAALRCAPAAGPCCCCAAAAAAACCACRSAAPCVVTMWRYILRVWSRIFSSPEALQRRGGYEDGPRQRDALDGADLRLAAGGWG